MICSRKSNETICYEFENLTLTWSGVELIKDLQTSTVEKLYWLDIGSDFWNVLSYVFAIMYLQYSNYNYFQNYTMIFNMVQKDKCRANLVFGKFESKVLITGHKIIFLTGNALATFLTLLIEDTFYIAIKNTGNIKGTLSTVPLHLLDIDLIPQRCFPNFFSPCDWDIYIVLIVVYISLAWLTIIFPICMDFRVRIIHLLFTDVELSNDLFIDDLEFLTVLCHAK